MNFLKTGSMLLCLTAVGCSTHIDDKPGPTARVDRERPAAASIARGEILVEAKCLRCHSRTADQNSPHASAPSFATLFTHYPPDYIAESFAEGVFVGHSDMPPFQFEPDEIDDLVAYFKQLPAK
jgi:mono/diheme cytochrome c family protein|tara:strand:+ start:13227 stop:13598 length:372 start_codon:yes stop_codon:yes gene_type:complete